MLVQTKLWLQEPDSGSYGNFAVIYRLSALYAVKAFLGRKKKVIGAYFAVPLTAKCVMEFAKKCCMFRSEGGGHIY